MKPKRIQRKRTKNWRMPDNCVYVGRPTKWGNPYRVTDEDYFNDPQKCVDAYRSLLERNEIFFVKNDLYMPLDPKELRGKDLACFCPLNAPCHANLLLELANEI